MALSSPVALALGAGLAPPTGGAADSFFLKIDAIPGDSADAAAHPHEIEVLGFDWSVNNTLAPGAGGGGAGKAVPSALNCLARTSKASPLLFAAAASGQHLGTAVLSVLTRGANPKPRIDIALVDVAVSGYEVYTDASDARPLDLISLSFARIAYSFHTQDPDGTAGEIVTASWNFKTNSAR